MSTQSTHSTEQNKFQQKVFQKTNEPERTAIIDPKLKYDYNLLKRNDTLIYELIKDSKGMPKVLKTSLNPNDGLYQTKASENYTHQLIQMVHYAYYNHYPLSFSPDDIQLLITQGFCTHIKKNAEKFRNKFVEHKGQKELIVLVEDGNYNNYNWPSIISDFSDLIQENIGEEKYKLCVHQYSTTNDITKTCYEVSLMDTMQKYFKYTMMIGCGISKVKLLGTLEDWIKIRDNLERLREFELDWWVDKLAPVLDQFIKFYQGDVDTKFWGDIYKYQERESFYSFVQEYATGWITYFFPYRINENQGFIMGDYYVKNDFSNKDQKYIKLIPKQIPTGISKAPVQLVDEFKIKLMDINFNAGFMGVGIDNDGFLYSQKGWIITQV